MRTLLGRPRRATATWLALAALALAARGAARGDDEGGGAVPPEELRAPVKTTVAVAGDLPVRVHALGTVVARPDRAAAVVAQVAGFVAGVEVADGDRVKAAAPLVRLDARPFEEALAKARAAVASAKAEQARAATYSLDADQADFERAAVEARALVAPAKREAERQAGLQREGLAAEKAATDARLAAEAAERAAVAAERKAAAWREKGRAAEVARLALAVAAAEADIAPVERALAASVVRSPSEGRVSGLAVAAGQSVEAGAVLAQVVAEDAPALRLALVPADAEAVAPGAEVTVVDHACTANVRSIGGAVDADTGLVPVLVGLEGCSPAPRFGETLLVEVVRGKPAHGILLPAAALEVRDDVPRVMVVGAGDLAHPVTVRLLARGPSSVLVEGEGLAAGARVVVEGNYNLPDGAHVLLDDAAPKTPGASASPPAMKDADDK